MSDPVAILARKILELESRSPRVDGTVTDPEWFDLVVALWTRLRADGEIRRNLRLPAASEITLVGGEVETRANVLDVSHTGLRIAGRLSSLRPGFSVMWREATVAGCTVQLEVPCFVIWCESSGNGQHAAGLEFAHVERRDWGRGFFDWYYVFYRDYLSSLAAREPPAPSSSNAAARKIAKKPSATKPRAKNAPPKKAAKAKVTRTSNQASQKTAKKSASKPKER